VVAEEDAVVLSAEADQRGCAAFELLGSAFAGENIAAQGLGDLDCDGLLDAADISLCLIGPDDLLGPVTVPGSSSPSRPSRGQTRRGPAHAE
jgi:hypothetical protein